MHVYKLNKLHQSRQPQSENTEAYKSEDKNNGAHNPLDETVGKHSSIDDTAGELNSLAKLTCKTITQKIQHIWKNNIVRCSQQCCSSNLHGGHRHAPSKRSLRLPDSTAKLVKKPRSY